MKGDWSKYEKKVLENAKKQARFDAMDLGDEEMDNTIEMYVDKAKKSLDTLKNKFKLDEIMREMDSLGIQHTDYKSDNIRKRGQDYVIIDMSEAKSPGSEPKYVNP